MNVYNKWETTKKINHYLKDLKLLSANIIRDGNELYENKILAVAQCMNSSAQCHVIHSSEIIECLNT